MSRFEKSYTFEGKFTLIMIAIYSATTISSVIYMLLNLTLFTSILQYNSKDSELNGRISKREFQRAVDGCMDMTDAESSLLLENLTLPDGSHPNDVDYFLLLLILLEPFKKSPIASGIAGE
jgi:hypothetical protein